MPETTIPEAKRKSHESRKTVDGWAEIRSDIVARTEHHGNPVGMVSMFMSAPISTGEQTDLGIVQLLKNIRLEKQNARIVTPRRCAHELRTWRA